MITATKKAKKLKRPAGELADANGEMDLAPGRGNKTGDSLGAKSDGQRARQASDIGSATNGESLCAGRKTKRSETSRANGHTDDAAMGRETACADSERPSASRKTKTPEIGRADGDSTRGRQGGEISGASGDGSAAPRKTKRGDENSATSELASATRAGAISVVPKGEPSVAPAQTNGAAMRIVPNGKRLLSAPKSKRGKIWSASNGEIPCSTPGGEMPDANGDHRGAPKKKRAAGEHRNAKGEASCASRAASNGNGKKPPRAKATDADNPERDHLCQQIMAVYRARNFHMDLRKQMANAFGAMLRSHMGYRANLPKEEAEPIKELVADLVKKLDTAKALTTQEQELVDKAQCSILSHTMLSEPVQTHEAALKKQLESLAKMLHVAGWVAGVKGLGFLTVANIIGETGDLWNYSTIDKVWKRMGMAPIKGKMPSNWRMHSKEKLSAEEWTEAGYCPRRRSVMWNAAAAFVKQIKKDDEGNIVSTNPYREYYDAVKVKAAELHPDWTPAHVNNHALLLVGKRLLRDLYRAWRGEQQ